MARIKAEEFSLGSELSCLRSLATEAVKDILHYSRVNSSEIHHCILQ